MLDSYHDIVPGTVHLVDVDHDIQGRHLDGDQDIVLVPKPSSDPEDPLNWSKRRKGLAIGMVYCYTIGLGISSAVQYSVLTQITEATGITNSQLNLGTGLQFLFLGWGNLIWQPIALTYGRRGVYVLSAFLCVFPIIWSAYSTSAGEWYAHRIIFGFVGGPIESLPEISVPDLFFAHERGTYMGIYVFLLFGCNFVAPLCAGWIDLASDWQWVMYFGALVQAASCIIMYFFLEETIYFRNTVEGVDDEDSAELSVAPETGDMLPQKKEVDDEAKVVEESTTISPGTTSSQTSYWQKLALFRSVLGRPSIKQMFKMMYRPLLMMYHFPSITWAGLVYGTCLSWYNVLNATTSSLLSASPYFFSSGLVGTAYTAPLIGAAFAGLWSGWATDKFAIRLARRNNGIREPEHRLWALSLSGLLCAGGLILWGVGAANDLSWVGLVFGLGMLAFSVIAGGSITLSYAVDCFKEISGETMMSVVVIRNTTGFAISYAINPWIDAMGVQNCFITAAMIALGCTATFLPMIYYGKSLRKASATKYWEYVRTAAATHA